jgi:hypothetical protein
MTDRIVANVPFIDAEETIGFYTAPGFQVEHQDNDWLIMTRGPMELEFFPFPDLDSAQSSFSACVRVADLDALYAQWDTQWRTLGLPEQSIPRLQGPPWPIADGLRMFAVIDPNGTLLRRLGELI